jgi:hypothetical protein
MKRKRSDFEEVTEIVKRIKLMLTTNKRKREEDDDNASCKRIRLCSHSVPQQYNNTQYRRDILVYL